MAWLFQDSRQKAKLGSKAPWSVGWYDPNGKKRSERVGLKTRAKNRAREIEGQLQAGVYENAARKEWAEFRDEYDQKILSGLSVGSRISSQIAFKHFTRMVSPRFVRDIQTATIDEFTSKRRTEQGLKKESIISPATVNKELRSIEAALRIAHDWEYITKVPKFKMLREPDKIPLYVTPEHFASIYQACEHAERPATDAYTAAEWWRALLVFIYMTG